MSLTAKISGDKLYAYVNDGSAPNDGGCCASTLRAYDQEGSYEDIDLSFVAEDIFPDSDYAYATHTFDIFDDVAYLMVQYEESGLNDAKVRTERRGGREELSDDDCGRRKDRSDEDCDRSEERSEATKRCEYSGTSARRLLGSSLRSSSL